MAMQMQRAFNSRMLTRVSKYSIGEGHYDETNEWIEGKQERSTIYGVLQAGNKFSQFDEGISLHNEVGGKRYTDYRSLYVTNKTKLKITDKVGIKGTYYNILQMSDEDTYGFYSYLLEKSKTWRPS